MHGAAWSTECRVPPHRSRSAVSAQRLNEKSRSKRRLANRTSELLPTIPTVISVSIVPFFFAGCSTHANNCSAASVTKDKKLISHRSALTLGFIVAPSSFPCPLLTRSAYYTLYASKFAWHFTIFFSSTPRPLLSRAHQRHSWRELRTARVESCTPVATIIT